MVSRFIWILVRFFAKDPALSELASLQQRNAELNLKLMRKSAEASEAREELRRWAIEIERVADQRGHNLCFIDLPRLFRETIGDRGGYPDFQGLTRTEFEAGCRAYQDDLFGPKKENA
jgi:hypothetical protein